MTPAGPPWPGRFCSRRSATASAWVAGNHMKRGTTVDAPSRSACATPFACFGRPSVLSSLLLATVFATTPVSADEAAERLDDVTVRGARAAMAESDAIDRAAFVTVIEATDFVEGATSLPELLQKSVGVTIRRFGGPGALATASIRGSSAEQVTVLLDGIPLNRARSGAVNLSNIPLRVVERIEVYRSFAPLRFQPSSIGGVINIVTRRPSDEPTAEARATYGSFGSYEVNGAHSARHGTVSHLLSATFAGSDGDFEFEDDNGTRVEPSDDETTTRKNNDFDGVDLFGKVLFSPDDDFELEAFAEHFDKDEGVPGIASNQSRDARLDTRRNLMHLKATRAGFIHPDLDARARVFGLLEETRFRDRQGEIGLGRQDNVNETRAAGADVYVNWLAGEGHVLSALATVQHEVFDGRDKLADVHFADQKRTVYQAGVEDQIFLMGGRLTLEPQLLYTYLDNDFDGDTGQIVPVEASGANDDNLGYRLGGRFDVNPFLAAKFNGGRAYRYPNLTELFGDRGTVIGNPGLDPETSWRWDFGLEFDRRDWLLGPLRLERAFLAGAAFRTDSDDLILFEQNSQRTVRPVNVSDAETWGIEAAFSVELFGFLNLKGNYTYTDSENTSDIPFLSGNQLPGIPESELFLRADVVSARARAWYEYDYLDGNYLDRANFERVDDRRIHNVGLTMDAPRDVMVTFEVKNITDEQVSDVLGFPLPGRAYVGTVLAKF